MDAVSIQSFFAILYRHVEFKYLWSISVFVSYSIVSWRLYRQWLSTKWESMRCLRRLAGGLDLCESERKNGPVEINSSLERHRPASARFEPIRPADRMRRAATYYELCLAEHLADEQKNRHSEISTTSTTDARSRSNHSVIRRSQCAARSSIKHNRICNNSASRSRPGHGAGKVSSSSS